jgi:hypothetical protein
MIAHISNQRKSLASKPALTKLRTIDEVAELGKFIELAWAAVEPTRKYVSGWHIDAIVEHLESGGCWQTNAPRHCRAARHDEKFDNVRVLSRMAVGSARSGVETVHRLQLRQGNVLARCAEMSAADAIGLVSEAVGQEFQIA